MQLQTSEAELKKCQEAYCELERLKDPTQIIKERDQAVEALNVASRIIDAIRGERAVAEGTNPACPDMWIELAKGIGQPQKKNQQVVLEKILVR